MQAAGAQQQAKSQAKAAEYNASVARQEAQAIRTQADYSIYQQRKKKLALTATQTALYSKAGVLLEGSPLDVINDSAANAEMDIMITDYNAKVGMAQQESQARLSEYQATQYKQAGKASAMQTLLTTGVGMASTYGMLQSKGTTQTTTQTTPTYTPMYNVSI
jgi:hypothetical protein